MVLTILISVKAILLSFVFFLFAEYILLGLATAVVFERIMKCIFASIPIFLPFLFLVWLSVPPFFNLRSSQIMTWCAICQSMVKNSIFQIELDCKDSLSDFFWKKQNYRFSVWISSGGAWERLFLSQAPRWYVLYGAKAYFPNFVGDRITWSTC